MRQLEPHWRREARYGKHNNVRVEGDTAFLGRIEKEFRAAFPQFESMIFFRVKADRKSSYLIFQTSMESLPTEVINWLGDKKIISF